ncbi:type II toxin-antitoxin system PemK/MazF family toxin [Herbidospora cretacea]|uniref:type II toxin-antitoxin system PemK/MazF family toxin n=1 Tax=Herbidospora cretacea TaxID=28444 RepID=UPI0009EE16AA|nr:type II toxin-antitoxin system PemK/MazF family toxin [Herbidospora cretacea]
MPGPYVTGGVYLVSDKALRLIPEEERVVHDERRPVVVVTGGESNSDSHWPFVLVCPISGSTSRRTRFDIQLARGQGGVVKKCWIRIPAVQPLMKSVLEDRSGALDEDLLTQVQARLAQYLGLLG